MTMILNKIQDHRDNLEKARRIELVAFAHSQGVTGIQPTMPAQLIRKILRSKGLVDISIPDRPLGGMKIGHGSSESTAANTVEVSADDDLMQQWLRSQGNQPQANQPQEVAPEKPKRGMTEITRLRQECKAKGIKMKRTDKMVDLRAKLNGTDTPNSSQ